MSNTDQKAKNNQTALKFLNKYKSTGLYVILDTEKLHTFKALNAEIPARQIVIIERNRSTFRMIEKARVTGRYRFKLYHGELSHFMRDFKKLYPSYCLAGAYLDFCGSLIGNEETRFQTDPIAVMRHMAALCIEPIPVVLTVSNIGVRGHSQMSRMRKIKNRELAFSTLLPQLCIQRIGFKKRGGYKIYKAQSQMSIEKLEVRVNIN